MRLLFKSLTDNEGGTAIAEHRPQILAQPPKEPPIPTRGPVGVDLSTNELTEYIAVADRIGIKSGAVIQERLRHCLRDENIHQYNNRQVVEFLNEKLGKDKWHWRGMRQCDVDELSDGWGMTINGQRISFSDNVYDDKIPLPVLLTIEKIQKVVPEVNFYISTAGLPDEDPFLLVTKRNIGTYIVERWDEPDFRER
jgi:hypothetical protein